MHSLNYSLNQERQVDHYPVDVREYLSIDNAKIRCKPTNERTNESPNLSQTSSALARWRGSSSGTCTIISPCGGKHRKRIITIWLSA